MQETQELFEEELEFDAEEQLQGPHKQRNIAVAFDGSETSISALNFTIETLLRPQDLLVIYCVLPNIRITGIESKDIGHTVKRPQHYVTVENHETVESPEKQLKAREAAHDLRSILSNLTRANNAHIHTVVKIFWGEAKKVIIKELRENPVDTIVIGSGGKSLVKSVVVGSVSQHILQEASTRVVVVKDPK